MEEEGTGRAAGGGESPIAQFGERFQHHKQEFESKHPAGLAVPPASPRRGGAGRDGEEPRELNIFDFDGTVFRSPEPNFTRWSAEAIGKLKGHPRDRGLGWFQEVITLSTPYVPEAPGDEWWNQQLVKRIRDSMASPSATTVLLTGRTLMYMENIQKIINHLHFKFDEIGLKDPPEMKTMEFKKEFINNLVEKYKPHKINMWEDRPNHADEFSLFLLEKKKTLGIDFEVHFVEMPPNFLPEEKEMEVIEFLLNKHGKEYIIKDIVEYTGVLIDKDSHRKLINAFPPKPRWAKKAHHMTMCLGEMREDLFPSVDKELYAIGRKVELEVVAYGEDDKAAAVRVRSDVPTLNTIPHVTVAISPMGRARDSNDIKAWRPVRVVGQTYPEEEVTVAPAEGSEAPAAESTTPKAEPVWIEQPLILKGTIFQNVRLHIGAKPKPPVVKTPALNFGKIITKHHPDVKGPQIGKMVIQIKQWTQETGTVDEVLIEEFIKNLTIQ